MARESDTELANPRRETFLREQGYRGCRFQKRSVATADRPPLGFGTIPTETRRS